MTAQAVIFTPQARQSQANFREALECMARPGRIGTLSGAPFPIASARYAYALLLALADQEVSIALPSCDELTARFASLGTGSPLREAASADYVLCVEDSADELLLLSRGTLECPEAGATAILAVHSLTAGAAYRLAGPGVLRSTLLRVSGFGQRAIDARNTACQSYPLGIDLFLVDVGGRIAGIPRTSVITAEAE